MSVEDVRFQIDAIDDEILELLRRRAELAAAIGREKAEDGDTVYDPTREAEILRRLHQLEASPLDTDAVQAIYCEIISACRTLQRPLKVIYLGPEHSFSHLAALQQFGQSTELLAAPTITDVFRSLERRLADLAVVPIENSTGGVVPETMDCLLESDLRICGELYVPVDLFLMANCQVDQIKRVYSHPQPLAQARGWLQEHLAEAEIRETTSTAVAALAASQEQDAAAIGPQSAAEAYGLQVLFANIQDSAANRTRFFVIGHQECPPTDRDKTSIVFSTAHKSGALQAALTPLATHQINLTFIQSRPVPGRLWEYVFFVDFEGHLAAGPVQLALDELGKQCSLLKVLGSYPAAD